MDINPDAVMVARNRLDFSYAPQDADYVAPEIKTYVHRNVKSLMDNGLLDRKRIGKANLNSLNKEHILISS